MKLGDVFLRCIVQNVYPAFWRAISAWFHGWSRVISGTYKAASANTVVGDLGCPEAFSTEIKHSELFPTLIMRFGLYIIAMWSISLDVFRMWDGVVTGGCWLVVLHKEFAHCSRREIVLKCRRSTTRLLRKIPISPKDNLPNLFWLFASNMQIWGTPAHWLVRLPSAWIRLPRKDIVTWSQGPSSP